MLNASTPRAPRPAPVIVFDAVTLSLLLMNDDNAAVRVIQDLRALAQGAAAGTRLPTVRELTARHQASPVTVAAAIRRLAAEGLVEAQPGPGTFVARTAGAG